MSTPLAVQLYSVRRQLAEDFVGVVRRIAAMGYAGVEPFNFPGITPQAARELFDQLGLAVPSLHCKLPLGADQAQVLAEAQAVGTSKLVVGLGPEAFVDQQAIEASCERFNQAYQVAAAHGFQLALHNHWWEYQPNNDGVLPYQRMLELLDPAIQFELDIYWITTGGQSPLAILPQFGSRASLLHVKDGPCVVGEPMVAVGAGKVDLAGTLAIHQAEWLIVELDECATDMFEAIEASYTYLTGKGYGHGRAI